MPQALDVLQQILGQAGGQNASTGGQLQEMLKNYMLQTAGQPQQGTMTTGPVAGEQMGAPQVPGAAAQDFVGPMLERQGMQLQSPQMPDGTIPKITEGKMPTTDNVTDPGEVPLPMAEREGQNLDRGAPQRNWTETLLGTNREAGMPQNVLSGIQQALGTQPSNSILGEAGGLVRRTARSLGQAGADDQARYLSQQSGQDAQSSLLNQSFGQQKDMQMLKQMWDMSDPLMQEKIMQLRAQVLQLHSQTEENKAGTDYKRAQTSEISAQRPHQQAMEGLRERELLAHVREIELKEQQFKRSGQWDPVTAEKIAADYEQMASQIASSNSAMMPGMKEQIARLQKRAADIRAQGSGGQPQQMGQGAAPRLKIDINGRPIQ